MVSVISAFFQILSEKSHFQILSGFIPRFLLSLTFSLHLKCLERISSLMHFLQFSFLIGQVFETSRPYLFTPTNTHTNVHAQFIHTYTHTHTHTHARTHARTHTHTHKHTRTRTHTHTHTHTQTHTHIQNNFVSQYVQSSISSHYFVLCLSHI